MNSTESKMSVWELMLLTAVNMIGAGIILLPASLAQVGGISIFSWIITSFCATCLAYAFAKCGMYSRKPGGMGGYAEYIFGTAGNFLCCYTYTVSILVSNVAIALSAVGYGATCLDISLGAVPTCLYTIGVIWLTTVPNFRGAGITGRIGGITILGVLIPVFIIATAGWFFFSPSIFVMNWNVQNLPFSQGILQSVVMTLWAFLGLESACVNADAVENPERNVPIAVLGGYTGQRGDIYSFHKCDFWHASGVAGSSEQCSFWAGFCVYVRTSGRKSGYGPYVYCLSRLPFGVAVYRRKSVPRSGAERILPCCFCVSKPV